MEPLIINTLGTGGGRFVMISQRRRTAGIRLVRGETHIHVDPGPGGLVFSNWAGLSPSKLDALVVTHCHPDHYCDAEVFIEAMSRGATKKRGILAAPKSVLYGNPGCGPSISSYHQRLIDSIVTLDPGSTFNVSDLKFTAVEARHSDPDTVGFRVEVPRQGTIGYSSDTGYFPEIAEVYRSVRLLILCTMRPRGAPLHLHLSTDEALNILEKSRPKCVILTHFGMKMLNANPSLEAAYLERETGIPTVAARDGMRVTLGERIQVSGPRKRDEDRTIDA